MKNKLILNFSDAPTYSKILPIVGLLAGVGYARHKKVCFHCHILAGIGGFVLGSLPLIYKAKKAGGVIESVSAVKISETN